MIYKGTGKSLSSLKIDKVRLPQTVPFYHQLHLS